YRKLHRPPVVLQQRETIFPEQVKAEVRSELKYFRRHADWFDPIMVLQACKTGGSGATCGSFCRSDHLQQPMADSAVSPGPGGRARGACAEISHQAVRICCPNSPGSAGGRDR